MKFEKSACLDSMYTELPFLERIKAAQKDGFEFFEFWSWTDKDIEEVKQTAKAAGIGISGFNGDADYSLIDPSHKKGYLEFLEKSAATAKKLGARSVTIHSNALGDLGKVVNHYTELSDTVKICSMYDTLLDCTKIIDEYGICMNLEPLNVTIDHVGNYLKNTQMAAEITRLVDHPKLKVLYDVYHMQLNEGSLCDTITKYVDQIGYVHVADVPGRHEPGTGEINYHKVFSCLDEAGYEGLIGYELFPETTTEKAVKAIMAY